MNKVDLGNRTRGEWNGSGRNELDPEITHLLLPFAHSAVHLISLNTAMFVELTRVPFQELEGRREAKGLM